MCDSECDHILLIPTFRGVVTCHVILVGVARLVCGSLVDTYENSQDGFSWPVQDQGNHLYTRHLSQPLYLSQCLTVPRLISQAFIACSMKSWATANDKRPVQDQGNHISHSHCTFHS